MRSASHLMGRWHRVPWFAAARAPFAAAAASLLARVGPASSASNSWPVAYSGVAPGGALALAHSALLPRRHFSFAARGAEAARLPAALPAEVEACSQSLFRLSNKREATTLLLQPREVSRLAAVPAPVVAAAASGLGWDTTVAAAANLYMHLDKASKHAPAPALTGSLAGLAPFLRALVDWVLVRLTCFDLAQLADARVVASAGRASSTSAGGGGGGAYAGLDDTDILQSFYAGTPLPDASAYAGSGLGLGGSAAGSCCPDAAALSLIAQMGLWVGAHEHQAPSFATAIALLNAQVESATAASQAGTAAAAAGGRGGSRAAPGSASLPLGGCWADPKALASLLYTVHRQAQRGYLAPRLLASIDGLAGLFADAILAARVGLEPAGGQPQATAAPPGRSIWSGAATHSAVAAGKGRYETAGGAGAAGSQATQQASALASPGALASLLAAAAQASSWRRHTLLRCPGLDKLLAACTAAPGVAARTSSKMLSFQSIALSNVALEGAAPGGVPAPEVLAAWRALVAALLERRVVTGSSHTSSGGSPAGGFSGPGGAATAARAQVHLYDALTCHRSLTSTVAYAWSAFAFEEAEQLKELAAALFLHCQQGVADVAAAAAAAYPPQGRGQPVDARQAKDALAALAAPLSPTLMVQRLMEQAHITAHLFADADGAQAASCRALAADVRGACEPWACTQVQLKGEPAAAQAPSPARSPPKEPASFDWVAAMTQVVAEACRQLGLPPPVQRYLPPHEGYRLHLAWPAQKRGIWIDTASHMARSTVQQLAAASEDAVNVALRSFDEAFEADPLGGAARQPAPAAPAAFLVDCLGAPQLAQAAPIRQSVAAHTLPYVHTLPLTSWSRLAAGLFVAGKPAAQQADEEEQPMTPAHSVRSALFCHPSKWSVLVVSPGDWLAAGCAGPWVARDARPAAAEAAFARGLLARLRLSR